MWTSVISGIMLLALAGSAALSKRALLRDNAAHQSPLEIIAALDFTGIIFLPLAGALALNEVTRQRTRVQYVNGIDSASKDLGHSLNKLAMKLEPMFHKLRAKYRSDPERLKAELIKLYRQHDCTPIDGKGFLGSLIQLPIGAGLYMAIKRGLGSGGNFLWISNLARPDAILALLIGVLTYLVSVLSPSAPQQARIIVALIPALLTVYVAWNLASGVGLYWATSATVDMLQSALLRRNSQVTSARTPN